MNRWRRHGLLAALLLAGAGTLAFATSGDDFAQRLTELQERWKATQQEFYKQIRAEKDEDAREKLWESRPGKEFVTEFQKLASDAKGTETAEKALLEVLDIAGGFQMVDVAKAAVATLMKDHIASEGLGALAGQIPYAAGWYGQDDAAKVLRELTAKSPHKSVQAGSLFALGSLLAQGTKEQVAEARAALKRVVDEYGELPLKRGGTWGERAKGWLYELDNLQIGMLAPDFESIDENGVPFRVSDYRGKVVVLDFWGIW